LKKKRVKEKTGNRQEGIEQKGMVRREGEDRLPDGALKGPKRGGHEKARPEASARKYVLTMGAGQRKSSTRGKEKTFD